jgi:hypothetical protein
MPAPNDTLDLPQGVELILHANVRLEPKPALAALLVEARSCYDWPSGTGPNHSQQTILTLEATVAELLNNLNTTTAHQIVTVVSRWAGNNASSHVEGFGVRSTLFTGFIHKKVGPALKNSARGID